MQKELKERSLKTKKDSWRRDKKLPTAIQPFQTPKQPIPISAKPCSAQQSSEEEMTSAKTTSKSIFLSFFFILTCKPHAKGSFRLLLVSSVFRDEDIPAQAPWLLNDTSIKVHFCFLFFSAMEKCMKASGCMQLHLQRIYQSPYLAAPPYQPSTSKLPQSQRYQDEKTTDFLL